MPDVPNVDSNQVSWISSYNILDNTDASSVTPKDIGSSSNVETLNGYNNGVVADYSGYNGRTYKIRFTTDGWITAHMDRSENYKRLQGNPDNIYGLHDIVQWYENSENNIDTNTLERSINDCLKQLDNWSTMQSKYNSEEVKLYNYEFSSSNISLFSHSEGGGSTHATYNLSFQYTDTTNIDKAVIAGGSYSQRDLSSRLTIDNNGIDITNNIGSHYGAYDMTDLLINQTSSGDEIFLTLDSGWDSWWISANIVVIWS